jgi:hypothetical protein
MTKYQDSDSTLPLKNYIRAHETGDASFVMLAFSNDARIKGKIGDSQIDWSVPEYMTRFSGTVAPDEHLRKRTFELLDMSDNAAVAKVVLDYPSVLFVDYMSLLRVDGTWKIVAKTFNSTSKQ